MMKIAFKELGAALATVGLLALAACGGSSDSPAPAPAPAAVTTNVSTIVIDGALKNALVCMDANKNGICDPGEVQGRTDVAGKVTLAVPNADVGKYPLLAVVGTDAVDADTGPVTVAYVLSTPADASDVVSPLTTLVQQTIASTGASTAEATKTVQDSTGITASLFADFTKATAPADGSVSAATVARMLVVTTQKQSALIATAVGKTAADGASITQADLDKAIQKKLLEILPILVAALGDPAVQAATTPAAKEAALLAAATTLIANSGLTAAGVPTTVAINNQAAAPAPAAPATVTASYSVGSLSFGDSSNYFVRLLSSNVAEGTPDSSGNTKYIDRRVLASAGNIAKWGPGSDPWRAADQHWNGSAWVSCPINFENTSGVRDAQGNSVYNFCNNAETGKSSRATFDIAGKTMADVYAQVLAAGYTNLFIAAPSLLGTSAFPKNSSLFYQTVTPLTEAVSYYAAGPGNPVGTSNLATQYSASVSAGGIATQQAAGVACNSAESNGSGANSTSIDGIIAAKKGAPCVYSPGTFTYNSVTYSSGAKNEWWSQSTANLGRIGNAPVNSGVAPGYYTTNTLLRVAFTGTGANAVTYYSCMERFSNGSVRNCTVIGTGTYATSTLGDAKIMTFANLPPLASSLTYNRVFVERGGVVYVGYQAKLTTTNSARLNYTAALALFQILGIPAEDPTTPIALTAGSYQGSWDFTGSVNASTGSTAFIGANGSTSCQDRSDGSFYACTLTITNPATGAFTLTDSSSTATGTFNFQTGVGSGTFHDSTTTPQDGTFTVARR
jgi:hypothetical protein